MVSRSLPLGLDVYCNKKIVITTMVKKDKKFDAYIAKSADFAKPILNHIRELVHKTCPDAEEKIKWGMPFFDYKGEMLCHMAAFKQHAVMSFWKASLMKDPVLMQNAQSETSMGHLGRLTSMKDLPTDKKIALWIKEAMALNDKGINVHTDKGKIAVTFDQDRFRAAEVPVMLSDTRKIQKIGAKIDYSLKDIIKDQLNYLLKN